MTRKTSGRRGGGAEGGDAVTGRGAHVSLKKKRRRKASSARWLERQLNDPYVRAARQKGYRSRSAFKLAELDDRFHILPRGGCVVDLGAAPGGWSQIAAKRVAAAGKGRVIAVDIAAMEPLAGVVIVTADFLGEEAPALIRAALAGAAPGGAAERRSADVVLSDMAAPATGHRPTDHIRTMALCEAAFDFAIEVLAPGGSFVGKVLQGGTEGALLVRMKRRFRTVRHAKPEASRRESAESYVVAMGYRGGGAGD